MIHDKIQIRLTFVGNGPTLSYCKKYVHMNNLSHFIDFLPVMNHHKLNVFIIKLIYLFCHHIMKLLVVFY